MPNARINWIENVKIIAMFGVITFHFWIFYHKIPIDIIFFLSGWKEFLSLPLLIGWHGDFLFFITSGIGLTFFVESKKTLWLEFFKSRLKRIYIPYWVAISAMLIIQVINTKINNKDQLLNLPLKLLDWIYNFLLINVPGSTIFYSHYWFLFMLVQMYLLFPLIYWFIKRTNIWGVGMITVIHIVFKKYYLMIYGAPWLGLLIWCIPFCYGIYLGIKLFRDRERTERLLNKYYPLGFVLWFIGIVLNYNPSLEYASHPFLSIGTFMTIYKIASYNWSFPKLNKVFYEIYLIHFPMFIFSCYSIHKLAASPKPIIFIYYLVSTYIMAVGINYVSNIIIRGMQASTTLHK